MSKLNATFRSSSQSCQTDQQLYFIDKTSTFRNADHQSVYSDTGLMGASMLTKISKWTFLTLIVPHIILFMVIFLGPWDHARPLENTTVHHGSFPRNQDTEPSLSSHTEKQDIMIRFWTPQQPQNNCGIWRLCLSNWKPSIHPSADFSPFVFNVQQIKKILRIKPCLYSKHELLSKSPSGEL